MLGIFPSHGGTGWMRLRCIPHALISTRAVPLIPLSCAEDGRMVAKTGISDD